MAKLNSIWARKGLTGWRVWRGKHRATNQSTRVRRISTRDGITPIQWKDWEDYRYVRGERPPHYPVPAIPIRCGYQPTGCGRMRGVPYIWVCSTFILWTFWKDFGLVEERAGS